MPSTEFIGVDQINGPFIFLGGETGAFYGELVDIKAPDGKIRRGRVTALSESATLVQVFAGTDNLVPNTTRVKMLDKTLEVSLAPNIVGRSFNGMGEPIDGYGSVFGGKRVDINGMPLNPMARQYPRDFIHTGISAIDTLTTLIRGQKLPIFSGNGLPHNQL